MIRRIDAGQYLLIESQKKMKVLTLQARKTFAWINAGEFGEMLVCSHVDHSAEYILANGKYRLYEVKDEIEFTDLVHLELLVGNGKWQGYILPSGLPRRENMRSRIIPTKEIITKSAL
jgi:hypothetical protein